MMLAHIGAEFRAGSFVPSDHTFAGHFAAMFGYDGALAFGLTVLFIINHNPILSASKAVRIWCIGKQGRKPPRLPFCMQHRYARSSCGVEPSWRHKGQLALRGKVAVFAINLQHV